ncbi:MAG: M15 family metallopeptidase [Lachnospiraceae bacterium]|nr:M15 family metallopeptidase [Lachnospiraceae bacterium]
MKRSLNERAKAYFISMGRSNRILRGPAIVGLAVTMLLHQIVNYFKKGTKRFACTIFILCCFMVGNSFSYPVFQEENGFVSEKEKEAAVTAVVTSDITLADARQIQIDELEILDDDDVLEGYDDAELHGMEGADKYLLDEIIDENDTHEQADSETGSETDAEASEDTADAVGEQESGREKEPSFNEDDWKLVLINKQHPIPEDYTFTLGPIKTIKGTMKCDERIIEELLAMMYAASEDGVNLAICSPYRDFAWQEVLFNRKIKAYMNKGMSYMEAYKISSQAVTVPGASEHQIGLAIDIVSDTYVTLDEGFADTSAGKWLAEHCAEYGFILRYPAGKEYITSIEFEPWHFRYVGKEAATIIMEEELCLEEFWDKYL